MTRYRRFPFAVLRLSVIILALAFVAGQIYSAPVFAAGSPSTSTKTPKKKCKKGFVWSGKLKKCVKKSSELLTDEDLYWQARAHVESGEYALALDLLAQIKDQNQPRVLNYIGFSTRKLGDVDKGITYYHKALALDPNYNVAREYLGEGYLQKGDVEKAKAQLGEIAKRCGTGCEEYRKLANAIVLHVTGVKLGKDW